MKHLILAILLLCYGWVDAQSNIIANRITVKDSLALAGKWIKQINNDSTLRNAGEQSLSTDGALKKYVSLSPNNEPRNAIAYSWNYDLLEGDSIDIDMHGVRGNIELNYTYGLISDVQDSLKLLGGHFINNTRQTTLSLLNSSVIPAGESMVLKILRDIRVQYGRIDLSVNNQITFSNGDYAAEGTPITPIRMRINKNGQLYLTKIITPEDDNYPSVSIDPTWNSYDVIIDDTW